MKKYSPVKSAAWDDINSDKLKLDWNESDVGLPAELIQLIVDFCNGPHSSWYPTLNNSELLDSISSYCDISSDCIELVPSSDYGHEVILKWISKKTQGLGPILIIGPTYDNFRSTAESLLKEVVILDTKQKGLDYHLPKSINYDFYRLVYLVSPNNPTGDVVDKEVLISLLRKHHNTVFVIDEAYIDFVYDASVVEFLNSFKNLIVTRTFSKAFGLAAFRIGYLCSNPDTREELGFYNNVKHVNAFAKILLNTMCSQF